MRKNLKTKKRINNALVNNPNFKVRKGKCYELFKRLFDIFASLFAIILISWLLLILGILVKLTSEGPMIYKSIRVAKDGKEFWMYKFRSMYNDAEARKAELMKLNEVDGGVTFKIKDDPRITPFGKFIRNTSLDELPQLFNILYGHMSFIGPRAPLPDEKKLVRRAPLVDIKPLIFFPKFNKNFLRVRVITPLGRFFQVISMCPLN